MTQELADSIKRLRETYQSIKILDEAEAIQTINQLVELVAEMLEVMQSVKPIAVVQGDAAQHTNPHTKIMLNSSAAWLVTDADKSAHKNRVKLQNVELTLTKADVLLTKLGEV